MALCLIQCARSCILRRAEWAEGNLHLQGYSELRARRGSLCRRVHINSDRQQLDLQRYKAPDAGAGVGVLCTQVGQQVCLASWPQRCNSDWLDSVSESVFGEETALGRP